MKSTYARCGELYEGADDRGKETGSRNSLFADTKKHWTQTNDSMTIGEILLEDKNVYLRRYHRESASPMFGAVIEAQVGQHCAV